MTSTESASDYKESTIVHREDSAVPTALDHLVYAFKMWWQHLTMNVSVPKKDRKFLRENCGLEDAHILSLYKQFRLLVGDKSRDYLTVADVESHCPLLAANPLKKYTFRFVFCRIERLSFRDFVCNLSLVLSNSIGSPQLHLIRSIYEIGYFKGVTNQRDVVQMQKLLALFNCFDTRDVGFLDTQSLCPLLYDLLRADSDLSVSSVVPHSMISRMVNTAIASVHAKFPKICSVICSEDLTNMSSVVRGVKNKYGTLHDDVRDNSSTESGSEMNLCTFEGHRMLLTKEMFIRAQENLHLDQLLAMRL